MYGPGEEPGVFLITPRAFGKYEHVCTLKGRGSLEGPGECAHWNALSSPWEELSKFKEKSVAGKMYKKK